MILLDIAKRLKEQSGYEEIPVADILTLLRNGFESIADLAIEEGDGFSLNVPKFGTFKVLKKAARVGFNPQTKKKIKITEKLAFKLRTSSTLRGNLVLTQQSKKKKGRKKKSKRML